LWNQQNWWTFHGNFIFQAQTLALSDYNVITMSSQN
jgi:hypothetical protein